MVKIQLDLSEEANKKIKIYMALNDIEDKRIAINNIIEEIDNG